MSEISYQSFLEDGPGTPPEPPFIALPQTAITTRPREADRTLKVRVSKRQAKWLRQVSGQAGKGVDEDAVVRALIDLGRELDVDWALIVGGGMLRDAVRESVRVRRLTGD